MKTAGTESCLISFRHIFSWNGLAVEEEDCLDGHFLERGKARHIDRKPEVL